MSDTGQSAEQVAAAAAAAAAAAQKPWFDGADAETVGYLQNRGWDKAEPKVVALSAVKAHREAEKLIGAPADKIVRLPKDGNDAAGITELRTKLGVPADAKGYDFSAVKNADGSALDAKLTEALGTTFHANGVPKDAAPSIARDITKYLAATTADTAAKTEQAIAQEKDALKANWGNNFNTNMLVARQAAATLGFEPEVIAALEKSSSYSKVMEMFRNIGSRIGEDTFVRSRAPGSNGVMTSEQAKATLAERKADRVWVDKLQAGDAVTRQEFDTLTRMISAAKTAA